MMDGAGRHGSGALRIPDNLTIVTPPPYAPELSPFPQAFSRPKAHLCKIGAKIFDDLFKPGGDICSTFPPQECWNYFHAAGYASG